MKQFKSIPVLFSLALLVGFAAGRVTGSVNPSISRGGGAPALPAKVAAA